MAQLKDYPSIDIMNHINEIVQVDSAEAFKTKEMQIALTTTLKAMNKLINNDDGTSGPKLLGGHKNAQECVEEMDELGYAHVSICATKIWSYYWHRDFIINTPVEPIADAIKTTGGRIMGAAGYDPFRIMESLREIEYSVKELGFNYVWFHPLSFDVSPTDRRCYPLYAKCMELGIPVGLQVGQSAEVLPSDNARPMLVDKVAIEFPDLRINLSHTGWPWVEEWMSMLWRHPNVYGDISAYYASSLDEKLIRFMDSSRGRDKVMFGTNGLGLKRCKEEFLALDIKEETRRKVLYENAKRFLNLKD